jgi:hypothetical protein
MERISTIHLYTSTLPLTCDKEDKSTRVETQRYTYEALYVVQCHR